MKIKKLFKYNRGRQIFRLLPTDTDKLIIEERDREKKEAFFSCVNILTAKKVFTDLQFEEKYWIGIKEVYKDVIFFHKFERPDLPNHKGVIAFDINSQSILWENQNNLILISDDMVLLSVNEYGINKECFVNYRTGAVEEDTKQNSFSDKQKFANYIYSIKIPKQQFEENSHPNFKKKIKRFVIKDDINFVDKNGFEFFSFHKVNNKGKFDNVFYAVSKEGKIILEETLNKNIDKIEPESFFIKDNLLFLLFGQSGFGVYKII
jgi:hypothetical protein